MHIQVIEKQPEELGPNQIGYDILIKTDGPSEVIEIYNKHLVCEGIPYKNNFLSGPTGWHKLKPIANSNSTKFRTFLKLDRSASSPNQESFYKYRINDREVRVELSRPFLFSIV